LPGPAEVDQHGAVAGGGDDAGGVSRRALLLGGVGGGALAAAAGIGYAVERDNPSLRRLLGGCGSMPALPPNAYTIASGKLDSAAMRRTVDWTVALPPDHRPGDGTPVVLCLHGRNGSDGDLTRAAGLPAWASHAGLRLAFVAPSIGGADYWHPRASGVDPLTMAVGEVLPMVERRFGVGGSRQRRGALGWSMGGFGALLAAQQHPDTFAAAVGASPAVFPTYPDARRGHPDTFDSQQQWEKYGLWLRLDDLRKVAVRLDCGDADDAVAAAERGRRDRRGLSRRRVLAPHRDGRGSVPVGAAVPLTAATELTG
jgi:alpha-beta hydrolase superfamily lysophospholipase